MDDLLDDILLPTPRRRWTDSHEDRRRLERMDLGPMPLKPAPLNGNGQHGHAHTCAGCGRQYMSNRREVPGQRSWCGRPDCKKKAAAERAAAYRERKAQ